jgi:3-methylcrotonyl-CoA carboxylase alpha subunit
VVEPLGRGLYRVTEKGVSRTAYAIGPPEARWVFLNGRTYLLDLSFRADTAPQGPQDVHALAAPMPATVTRIDVEPGQSVHAGDTLVVLEAMKMELAIRAPRDATVDAIFCRVGELVQPNIALLELR